jgi:hypothetical protein
MQPFASSKRSSLKIVSRLKIARESDPTRLGFPWEIVNEPPKPEKEQTIRCLPLFVPSPSLKPLG